MLHRELTDQILRAFFRVSNAFPADMPESTYQRALTILLEEAAVGVEAEIPVRVYFRGQPIGEHRIDLIVGGAVIVECKVAGAVHPQHKRQLLRYLRITGLEVGLLLTFGPDPLCKRIENRIGRGSISGDVEFRRRDR